MAAQRTYLAIDLKSFYASVECVDRHLDPLTTNLVVADASRTEKTICLAVSPSLKAYKIPGRARLFEAVQRVKEVNAQRLQTAIRQKKAVRGEDGKYHFASTSFDANALNADPALGLSYIVAPPRMQRYLDVSTQIYKTYLRYVSPADIYPYSIDEVFIDVTGYLPYYHMSAHELAMTMVREVLYNTGITATAGIGTNLYLAKLAMDIVAKHIPADKDGVRIAISIHALREEGDKQPPATFPHFGISIHAQSGSGTRTIVHCTRSECKLQDSRLYLHIFTKINGNFKSKQRGVCPGKGRISCCSG